MTEHKYNDRKHRVHYYLCGAGHVSAWLVFDAYMFPDNVTQDFYIDFYTGT